MSTVHWKIKGMHCKSCEGLLQDIAQDHGATDISVNAKTGVLEFNTSQKTNLTQLKKEIEDEGYKVQV